MPEEKKESEKKPIKEIKKKTELELQEAFSKQGGVELKKLEIPVCLRDIAQKKNR